MGAANVRRRGTGSPEHSRPGARGLQRVSGAPVGRTERPVACHGQPRALVPRGLRPVGFHVSARFLYHVNR